MGGYNQRSKSTYTTIESEATLSNFGALMLFKKKIANPDPTAIGEFLSEPDPPTQIKCFGVDNLNQHAYSNRESVLATVP